MSAAGKKMTSYGSRKDSLKTYVRAANTAAKATGFDTNKATRMAKAVYRGKALKGSIDTKSDASITMM